MLFTDLGLHPSLLKAIDAQNYTESYPIQKEAIPAILNKRDVLAIAQTGSGKTVSYALPLLQNLLSLPESRNRHVDILVLVPTRELAVQVADVFKQLSSFLPVLLKTVAVFGGVSINPQMIGLQGVNVLVATPGRLLELVHYNAVNLTAIKTLVLDEADKMLNLGFKDEMKQIFGMLPAMRQNLLFSATLNDDITTINQFILNNPLVINIEPEKDYFELITQVGYFVTDDRKGPLLRHLIRSKNMSQVLIFTSSVYQADNVSDKLRKNGIDASAIHSKKSQEARTIALRRFKEGTLKVLVATDLMSRGIDVKFLPYVINYELPRSPKDYVHRIGRTGRAESAGEAITFVTAEDQPHFRVIQKKMGRWVDMIDSDELGI